MHFFHLLFLCSLFPAWPPLIAPHLALELIHFTLIESFRSHWGRTNHYFFPPLHISHPFHQSGYKFTLQLCSRCTELARVYQWRSVGTLTRLNCVCVSSRSREIILTQSDASAYEPEPELRDLTSAGTACCGAPDEFKCCEIGHLATEVSGSGWTGSVNTPLTHSVIF